MTAGAHLNILVVSPQLPYPPDWGFGIRVFQLMRQLALRHEVTLLSYAWGHQGEQLAALSALGFRVEAVDAPAGFHNAKRRAQLASLFSPAPYRVAAIRSGGMQASLDRLLAAERFDIVLVESSPAASLNYHHHPAVILDEHNIESELMQRMFRMERSLPRRLFNGLEYLKLRRLERQTWARVRACVCTSERDAQTIRSRVPGSSVTVVANGVDLEVFRPEVTEVDPDNLVFTGVFNYRPNVDAVLYFTREVLPRIAAARPRVTFTIVGPSAPPDIVRLEGPSVTVTGRVEDVRPYVARAAAVVVPLRMGGGTRLKVVEALAMGKAIVSSSVGCEGLDVVDGEHLLIADDPAVFAERVLRLLAKPDLRQMLGRQGRTLVERRYGWTVSGDRLDHLAGALAAEGVPTGSSQRRRAASVLDSV